jgi:hypothetical protein
MARKSPWQQFSDNFSSVYGTFQDLGRGLETSKIMREKPEEEIVQEGPRNSYERATGKYTYGGKTYDKEITPDELRGLQYNRLGDVMAKYGDPTGAMQMRTAAADIENKKASLAAQNLSNELNQKLMNHLVESQVLTNENIAARTANTIANTGLTNQQLIEMTNTMGVREKQEFEKLLGLQWDNKSKEYKAILEEATLADKIKISGIEVERAQVDLANERLKGEGWKIDNAGNLIKLGIDRATQKDEIALKGLEVEGKKQANINSALYGTGLVLDNRGKLVAAETAETLQDSNVAWQTEDNLAKMEEAKARSTAARLEDNANVVLLNAAEMKQGGSSPDEVKAYLQESFVGQPEIKSFLENIDSEELSGIMREAAVMMQKVEAAISGKTSLAAVKDDLTKLIDDQDSIPGNVEIKQGEGGAVWLIETDAEGNKTSEIKGKDFEEFKQNLIKTMSPMRATSIATANANLAKVEAQVAELTKIGLTEADQEKMWVEHWSSVSEALELYGEDPLTTQQIADMKHTFFNEVLKKHKAGIGNGDGEWTSTQI